MIPSMTVGGALAAVAATPRTLTTIEHDSRSRTIPYATLLAESLLIAGALYAAGLQPEDRVALVVGEIGDFICVFFALAAAGLVPVPLVPPGQARDLPSFARQSRHLLHASRAAAVVTSAAVAPLVDVSGLDPAPKILTVDELRKGPSLPALQKVTMHATALLQFTSGSTAAPKGVVLTHANLHANVNAIYDGLAVAPDDVGVSWLPLHHDMGLIGMLVGAVYARCDAVIMSPVLFLKRPTAWLDALSRYRGTVSFAPNFAYELCVRRVKPSQIEAFDLSRWRVAGCGAEPVRPAVLRAFGDQFARAGFRSSSFVPSYGLAEHSLAVTFSRSGIKVDTVDGDRLVRHSQAVSIGNGSTSTARAVHLVACGRPLPGHDLRIVGDDGRPLPERHVGQIVARGPSVMAEYFENPEATAVALRDGWLQTGDLGYIAGGELFVCGRTKDLIVREGRKYHPPDLESAIADVQGLRSSGIVVAPPGTIPRTTSGKVRRAETRARFEAGTLLNGGREL